jgi:hypothetical protein
MAAAALLVLMSFASVHGRGSGAALAAVSYDKFSIAMLYPTKAGGEEEWFVNMDNPASDSRFNPKTTLAKNPDGSWKVTSTKVRMNVFTSTGYDPALITTYDQPALAGKGYMQSPNDWRNVEITGYVKVNSAPLKDDDFSWYARGGKHTSTAECEGTAYKGDLFFSGKSRFSKQQWFPDGYSFTPKQTVMGSMVGKWVGFKFVMYNIVIAGQQGGSNTTVVKLENWVDKNNDGTWVKVGETTDAGGWGVDGTHCGGAPDQLVSWGGPIATFR